MRKDVLRAVCMAFSAVLAGAAAEAAEPWEKLKLGEAVRSIKLAGDLRLRHDASAKRGAGTNDRNRLRLRLRLGADVELPDNLMLGARLASGTGEQSSTNQSFGKLASEKEIWIDQAYLKWTPAARDGLALNLLGGRMPIAFWRPYAGDIVWDDDFSPEGLFEGFEWRLPQGLSVFASALQMVVNENSNSGKNQWLFSQYLGAETVLPWNSRFKTQLGYHKWSDENRAPLSAVAIHDGNRRAAAGGALLNRFGVGEFTAELSTKARPFPAAFQGSMIRNLRARNNDTTITGPAADDGYQYGFILGKAAGAGTWEAAAFKKYVETDATVADLADSDFGDGGTNRQGYIFWLAYNPRAWMTLKARYFITDTIDRQFAPGDKAINRIQWDVSVKF